MIKVVIIKASDDYWYQLRTIPNLESLLTICRQKGDIIIRKNWRYKNDSKDIYRFWDGMSLKDAKEISECEFELEIYDDYIE